MTLPLLVLLSVGVLYFITYSKQEKTVSGKQQIGYKPFFLILVAIGYFGIWIFWIVGIILLFLDRYYTVLDIMTCPFLMVTIVQIIGLLFLYIGSFFFAWAIGFAGKSLRPSTSGIHKGHILIQDGPLGIVRHPYYVSYVMMLVGLGFTLSTIWPFLLALLVAIGMVPTADAEEKQLAKLFGEEYRQYKRRVGCFFPKIISRKQ